METSAHDTLAEARLKAEWSNSDVIELLCDFIDNQFEQETFAMFMEDRLILESEIDD
jgi:hypothetical protein